VASGKLARKAKDVLGANRDNALKLAQGSGLKATKKLLQSAQADLTVRLGGVAGDAEETFTVAQKRATMAQLRQVIRELSGGLGDAVLDAGMEAAELAAAHTMSYLATADRAFRGVGTTPLALREASMFEEATQGARASILRRLASSGEPVEGADEEPHPAKLGILDRYSVETLGHFEKKMQMGILTGKSRDEMEADLVDSSPFLQGQPAFWATRIVRTEVHAAYNKAGYESLREADEQLDDMVKIISAVFDERTGSDSYATHGQIRRPEEPFETWYGLLQHPPDRSNDRGIVVPHRISWPIPKYLEWRTPEQVAARWAFEGRKQKMPPIPEMTTVALSLFGVQQPKQLDDGADG